MKISTGINGFGRFGIHLLKYWLDRKENALFSIDYINDENIDIDKALDIIRHDTYVDFSTYKVEIDQDNLCFLDQQGNKKHIQYSVLEKQNISWLGKPDIILECSGTGTVRNSNNFYLTNNTKLVIISATSWDADGLYVYGYNHTDFSLEDKIISYGSCTINAYIPLANYINSNYSIIDSDVNVIHNIQEYKLKCDDILVRKGCTLEKAGPGLLDAINSDNFRVNYTIVPYSGVSIIDYRFRVKELPSLETFISNLSTEISKGKLQGLYDIDEKDEGPEKYICTNYSSNLIKENINLLGDNIYIHAYFDNENSANRYYDLVQYITGILHENG